MRKLFIGAVLFALSGFITLAEPDNSSTRPVMVIDKAQQKNNHTRRVPELIPIECFYNGLSRQVEIVFRSGSGDAEVRLSNLNTGEISTVSETSAVILVPVQSDGLYMLEITLSNGREYYGTFSTEEEEN